MAVISAGRKKALEFSKYPGIHKRYLKREQKLVEGLVKPSDNLLDIGCGVGRLIPILAPIVNSYTGVDMDRAFLSKAREVSKAYKNSRVFLLDAQRLLDKFRKDEFDVSIMLWNTLACVKDPSKVLREAYEVTKDRCFVVVPAKGAMKKRIRYYDKLGLEYRIDPKTEFIHSDTWGVTRAYSESEIRRFCEKIGFSVTKIWKVEGFEYCLALNKT